MKKRVAVVGATGIAGQQFLVSLDRHPWFEVVMVAGVNLAHAAQITAQRRGRGWRGFIVPLPNCTTMGLVVTLKPLLDRFGIERVVMTSMQGVSGAGREHGVMALDILDNIVPF